MSSHHTSRRKGGKSKNLSYPGEWTDWIWSDQYQRNYRCRLKGVDEYEYDYQPHADNEPRIVPQADPIAASSGLYSSSEDYTTGSTAGRDNFVEAFAQTSLGHSSAKKQQPPSGTYGSNPAAQTQPYPEQTPTQSSQSYIDSSGSYTQRSSYSDEPPYATYSGNPSGSYVQPTAHGASASAPPLSCLIRTRDPSTDREAFDPHYKVHGDWAFKWGRIFKVLWSEPRALTQESDDSGTGSITVRKVAGGKEVVAQVRRFVIIKPMEGHCVCLPILTYSGQGLNKRGVHADHHAIIYSGKKPVAFRGEKEKGLQMRSIKVTPDNPRHKLDDASRLNYAKTYTVEYNVKVWFIGKVSSDSEWQIRTDYNRVHPSLMLKDGGGGYSPGYSGGGVTSASSYTASYHSPSPSYGETPGSYGGSTSYLSPNPTTLFNNPTYGDSQGYESNAQYPSGSLTTTYASPSKAGQVPYGGSQPASTITSHLASHSSYFPGSMSSTSVHLDTGWPREEDRNKERPGYGYNEAQWSTNNELGQLDLADKIRKPGHDDDKTDQRESDRANGQNGGKAPVDGDRFGRR